MSTIPACTWAPTVWDPKGSNLQFSILVIGTSSIAANPQ